MTGRTVVLCLGSNVHPRSRNISSALDRLAKCLEIAECSTVYESPSHTGCGDAYLNTVACAQWSGTLDELIAITKDIESGLGRTPQETARARITIDIDVVIDGATILRPLDFSCSYFQTGYRQITSSTALLLPNPLP